MSTPVALASILGAKAVEIAGIFAGWRIIAALIPQLRVSAPKEAPKQNGAEQAEATP